jgi:succinyl-CoA synthetase alpha subunit
MSIFIDQNTRVLVQGITGREGRRSTKEMLDYGTVVSCGVTPGKQGRTIEGLPVFDSVKEAVAFDGALNVSVFYVPPLMVLDAATEAIDAGIRTLVIVTENVPIKDVAKLFEHAQRCGARIIGPSSVGVIAPDVGRLGSIGGPDPARVYSKGPIGLISKSGGMCAETAGLLTAAGLGQSTVVGIGGDVIIGTTFAEVMELFQEDKETEVVVLFGEVGGVYEEIAAEMVREKRFTKPTVAFISGKFAESISRGLAMGHAGAVVEEGFGRAADKIQALREAGVLVADYHHQIPELVKQARSAL